MSELFGMILIAYIFGMFVLVHRNNMRFKND